MERQVKISGRAQPLEAALSDHYFGSRPYESKIAAWASSQSEVIPHREYLQKEFDHYRRTYPDPDAVPRPPHWGGYAISPLSMEFWQGGMKRLHDRIEYRKQSEGWIRQRLAP
jgi:pyridoxamine 5'-phosphate oxidase